MLLKPCLLLFSKPAHVLSTQNPIVNYYDFAHPKIISPKKCFSLLFFLALCFLVNAQKIDYGLGFTANHGQLFSPNSSQQIQNTTLSHNWSSTLGFNAFAELSSASAFDFRLSLHANPKTVKVTVIESITEQDTNTEFITYVFSSFDVSATIRYNMISAHPKWKVIPFTGFSFGINKFKKTDYVERANYASRIWENRAINESIQNHSFFVSAAVLGGVSIQPPLLFLNRQIEFTSIFHYAPLQFLNHPIDLSPFSIEGKYHFVSLGVNLFLNKRKKNV